MNEQSPLVFPKKQDKARLAKYRHYDLIYFGDHFDAFNIKGEKDFPELYRRLRYIVANFGGLMSRVMADMLFGEGIKIDLKDKDLQTFVDGLIEDNQFFNQLYESALANSRRGDSVFKMRVGQLDPSIPDSPSTIIIEEFTPAIYFPVLDDKSTRYLPKEHVIGMVFKQAGVTYLHIERHVPGKIYHEVYNYSEKDEKIIPGVLDVTEFGYLPEEDTKINKALVFHIPNVRDGSGFWGTSDYRDLDPLFFALNNRITKVDNILDKHSDPILAVPPGVIDEDGKVRKEALGMFEVDNETPGFNKPEYIVWNANLESAFTQIDKLVDMLFLFSEIAPASLGVNKDGNGGKAESGRALKFKLLATIRKRNRKMRYYDQAIKDILETALLLAQAHNITINGVRPSKVERPSIKWSDGVINDPVEQVEVVTARIDNGTMSRADGIIELDGVTQEAAQAKVKEIDDEAGPILEPISNNTNGSGTGAAGGRQDSNTNPEA